MTSSDKIVPFRQMKDRKKSEFRLETEVSIYICRNEKKYTFDCSSPDSNITIEEIMNILEEVLMDLSKKVGKIKISANDCYEVCFTLLCYKKNNNYKYICLPQNISSEKLAEYLFTFISIYKYKKNQH